MPDIAEKLQFNQRNIDKCILGIANGESGAFERLYQMTNSVIYAYALSVMKNVYDAQDVTHDCFVKVYLNAHTYNSLGKPMSWLLTIAKNICYSKFRSFKQVRQFSDDELERQLFETADIAVEDKLLVKCCLLKLSDDERTIVVLHAMSGLKHREIAKFLDLPLSTVITKYRRALTKLENILVGEQDE